MVAASMFVLDACVFLVCREGLEWCKECVHTEIAMRLFWDLLVPKKGPNVNPFTAHTYLFIKQL